MRAGGRLGLVDLQRILFANNNKKKLACDRATMRATLKPRSHLSSRGLCSERAYFSKTLEIICQKEQLLKKKKNLAVEVVVGGGKVTGI